MGFGGSRQESNQSSASETLGLSDSFTNMISNAFGSSSGQSANQSLGRSTSQGSSSSLGTSYGAGSSQSTGESYGVGSSESFGDTASSGSTFVDPVQQARLQQLYGAGSNLMGQQGNMQQVAQKIINPFMAQGNAAMKTLGGLQDVNAMVGAQTRGLQSGLARLGLEQRNQIGDAAGMQGAFGGSRHGIAEGVAQGETNRAFQEGYGDILSSARQQAGAAAGMAGNLAPVLANLGMIPSQAAWAPLQQFKSLLGAPTVLSEQQATGTQRATSENLSRSQQEATSQNISRSRQEAESQNLSSSLQRAFGWSKQEAENFARAQTQSRSKSLNIGSAKSLGRSSGSSAHVSLFGK